AGSAAKAGNYPSMNAAISADGRYVGFNSYATDLVAAFAPGNAVLRRRDLFLYDRLTGGTQLISHVPASPAAGTDALTFSAVLSDDGRFVGYTSRAYIQTAYDTSSLFSVYVYDSVTGVNTLVSHRYDSSALSAYGHGFLADMSGDGRSVIFSS